MVVNGVPTRGRYNGGYFGTYGYGGYGSSYVSDDSDKLTPHRGTRPGKGSGGGDTGPVPQIFVDRPNASASRPAPGDGGVGEGSVDEPVVST